MPYYDVYRASTTNASGGTENTHAWAKTIANQESVYIKALYINARFGTAGGGQMRIKTNTGTVASLGTANTPGVKNIRSAVAAQSTWFDDTSAITVGTILKIRLGIGMAQTGGQGGWNALEASDAFALNPNSVSPVDIEFTNVSSGSSVPFDFSAEFTEGV